MFSEESMTTTRTRDAPPDTVEDLVDAFPALQIQLDDNHTNVEEAINVHYEKFDKTSSTYNTDGYRGIAVIINNEKFDPDTKLESREGFQFDAVSVKRVLTRLKFNVTVLTNSTVKQMKIFFEGISTIDHSQNDCFLCVILSHGKDGGIIYGTDYSVALNDLISYILPNRCPSLTGKPKLFFVQACRGKKYDDGAEVKDAMGSFVECAPTKKIPLWADILIGYSSVPGYYSWNNCRKGYWFIQSLCYVLERYGNELEIHQIMTKVNYHVTYAYELQSNDQRMNSMNQYLRVDSMLTKELKFPPKLQTSSE